MKQAVLSILLCISFSFAFSQANYPTLTLYNANAAGTNQTPLQLGNVAYSGTGNPSATQYAFITNDGGASSHLEIHANRWGNTFLLTRDDPNGTRNMFQVDGSSSVAANVTLFNLSNQVSTLFTAQGDSYFNGGGLAIGTTSTSGYKLAVNGTAIFTKAIVKPYPWSDYVFDRDYRLPTLDSVSRYIAAHHHLPDMPSADSVAVAGIEIGNNQSLLLKKIEELTLYIIQQQKEIEELKKVTKNLYR